MLSSVKQSTYRSANRECQANVRLLCNERLENGAVNLWKSRPRNAVWIGQFQSPFCVECDETRGADT